MLKDGSIPASATGVITIDLGQLVANWRALAELVAPAECGAVVKADAYGLGAGRVIPALWSAGCRTFFIATPDEAAAARRFAPAATIYALDGLVAGATADLISAAAIPVLCSLDEICAWVQAASAHPSRLRAALHVDTGLNRLGLSETEVDAFARDGSLTGNLDVSLVMSHLACADDPRAAKNEEQREAFERLRGWLPPARASLAASDGLMLGQRFHYDLVRPGYALYGGQAFKGGATPVAPVVSLSARILQIRDVAAGGTVGYSATWKAKRPSRIAVIAAGYADGIPRSLSATNEHSTGFVGYRGQRAPIVGRVSMDLITVDMTGIGPPPQRGDFVDLIGPGLTIEAMGTAAGTIGYEVLTRLGPRFHRVYLGGT
jgi:alanine racemase